MEPKRLYRSSTNQVIGGVAAGLADYFKLDPLLVRLLFVIFAIVGGGAVLIYIILWIVTPAESLTQFQPINQEPMESKETSTPSPSDPEKRTHHHHRTPESRQRGNLVGGLVLITIGAIFLVDQFVPQINFGDLWPVILIVIGVALLVNAFGKNRTNKDKPSAS